MNPAWEMVFCALFGGIVGALFCLVCFPVSLFSGAIAVGLYLRIQPEIYISARQATGIGGLAGFFTAIFSSLLTWLLFSQLMDFYGTLIGQRAVEMLRAQLDAYGDSVLSLFVINLGLTFLFGVLGGWMSLRWVYQDHRIPKDL